MPQSPNFSLSWMSASEVPLRLRLLLLAVTGASSKAAKDAISGVCQADMTRLESIARVDSTGRRPDGKCYSHVADYIDASGYGGINKGGFNAAIPPSYWAEAHDFADYLNKNGNAARLGLRKLILTNPYNAPSGSIVVVRAGTPGTVNPTAGDFLTN